MSAIHAFRLHYQHVAVAMRLFEVNGRWLASADTLDGPSLGTGWTPLTAMSEALDRFDGVIEELLETAPRELLNEGMFFDY